MMKKVIGLVPFTDKAPFTHSEEAVTSVFDFCHTRKFNVIEVFTVSRPDVPGHYSLENILTHYLALGEKTFVAHTEDTLHKNILDYGVLEYFISRHNFKFYVTNTGDLLNRKTIFDPKIEKQRQALITKHFSK